LNAVFVTGGNGYLGSYACTELLRNSQVDLHLLVRAPDRPAALARLWETWQLHMSEDEFRTHLTRVTTHNGDLHAPDLGLGAARAGVVDAVDGVLHIAASLNRKSEKACLNSNLRGTLSVVKLARDIAERGHLDRYAHVSTVAVAGERDREIVHEAEAVDWKRSDYDPYGRTKKFAEHLAFELLPGQRILIFRPSIVLGDARFPQTTQFDMVRAFVAIADLPFVPLRPDIRLDIVNADWVGRSIRKVFLDPSPTQSLWHLSAGASSPSAKEITRALVAGGAKRPPTFVPPLEAPFHLAVRAAARLPRENPLSGIGSLLKVFLPYIRYDTVFDNDRTVAAVGEAPRPFPEYCAPLYAWSKAHHFSFPARPLSAPIA
jgi:thioester reductase-like protein